MISTWTTGWLHLPHCSPWRIRKHRPRRTSRTGILLLASKDIHVGDEIELHSRGGTSHYLVDGIQKVPPTDVSVLDAGISLLSPW